jgi:hypothetical protein
MQSPFPGMDPYIEACGLWGDFHSHLIEKIYDELALTLPERYFVRVEERAYVVLAGIEGKDTSPCLPDVSVIAPSVRSARGETALVEAETGADAVTMRAFIDEHYREHFIEIFESEPNIRLVTCIEVLSPSNKRPGTEGWELYLKKRKALMQWSANLVEIDLLRGGERFPMIDPWPNSPYYLLVCRQSRSPYCEVKSAFCHRPLPELSVPLASPDPDVFVALQPMVDAIYARSRYGKQIDYTKPITPPLSAEEKSLLAERLPGTTTSEKPKAPRRRRTKRR